MGDILIKILVCFIAGAGAGIGTGFAGMSAAAVIGPMLMTFVGVPAYDAVGEEVCQVCADDADAGSHEDVVHPVGVVSDA